MALFRRRRGTDQVDYPTETSEYYQPERRQSRAVAFALAIATVVITILLALGLYFGSRWIYNTFFGNDDTATEQRTDEEADQQDEQDAEETEDTESNTPDEQPEDVDDDPALELPGNGSGNSDNEGTSEDEEVADNQNGGQQSQEEDIPSTGPTEEDLPSTGPADTLAIFLAVSVLGAMTHKFVLNKR